MSDILCIFVYASPLYCLFFLHIFGIFSLNVLSISLALTFAYLLSPVDFLSYSQWVFWGSMLLSFHVWVHFFLAFSLLFQFAIAWVSPCLNLFLLCGFYFVLWQKGRYVVTYFIFVWLLSVSFSLAVSQCENVMHGMLG